MRNGAPGEIRTPDPLVRSQMLYPAELRAPSTIVTHTHLKSHECAPAIDNDYLPGHEVRRREIRESACQAPRQHDRSRLRHAVVRVARPREDSAERRDIDNAAAALPLHDWRGQLRAQKVRLQVCVHD